MEKKEGVKEMKLANALNERSEIQKRLSELQVRLNNNAKVQDCLLYTSPSMCYRIPNFSHIVYKKGYIIIQQFIF